MTKFPTWWFAIPVCFILCREISVSALREYMAEHQLRAVVKVGVLGKWKTALQMTSIAILIAASCAIHPLAPEVSFASALDVSSLHYVGLIGFYISSVLTLLSGYQYFEAAWNSKKEA